MGFEFLIRHIFTSALYGMQSVSFELALASNTSWQLIGGPIHVIQKIKINEVLGRNVMYHHNSI